MKLSVQTRKSVRTEAFRVSLALTHSVIV